MSGEPILPGDAGPPTWQDDPETVADVEDFLRDLDVPSPEDLALDGKIYAAETEKATPSRGLVLRPLGSYAVSRVIWLDNSFLQRAVFPLLAGRKGSLKGTLSPCLRRSCTRGTCTASRTDVFVVTASEDSVELDFLPQVLAAGGDPSWWTRSTTRVSMPRTIDWLRGGTRSISAMSA